MKSITLHNFVPQSGFLTGLTGRQIYPRLVDELGPVPMAQPFLVDFKDTTATGSFFSQAIFPLRDYARRLNQYLVLCNLNTETRLELAWLLEVISDAFLMCESDENGDISNVTWIGGLDEKQWSILSAVSSLGGVDATTLSQKFKEDHIGITGWNNRLASLSAKGLLIESKSGRNKIYKSVIREN